MLTYLLGLSAIVGIVGYVALFTHIRIKYFNDQPNDLVDLVLYPFMIPAAFALICFVPYIIGGALLGNF